MTYFISDTHFNHKNIIEYCDRPFETVEEMDEYIVNKWNSVVGKDDTVYHLGDFALGMHQDQVKDLLRKLNGEIILIMGNHDRKGKGWFEACGFKEVHKKGFELELVSGKYILSHRPQTLDKIPEGYVNIHGHIHNHNNNNITELGAPEDKYINVSCEVLDYTPVWID